MNDQDKARIIIAEVCAYHDLPIAVVMSKSHKRECVMPRQWAMRFIRNHTSLSLSETGRITGKKDHATVMHAIKTINNLIDYNGYRLEEAAMSKRIRQAFMKANQTEWGAFIRQRRVKNHRIAVRRKIRKMYKSA